MDKGIRSYTRALFVEMNEKRRRGEYGITKKADTVFRLSLCAQVAEEFGISMASAGGAYQEAFRFVKDLNSELVSGLGRPPEKNNGGRKKKVVAPVTVDVQGDDEVAELALLAAAGSVPDAPAVESVPNGSDELDVQGAPVIKYSVRKVSDGTVVCEDLTFEEASELIAKAVKAKKAKLEMVA